MVSERCLSVAYCTGVQCMATVNGVHCALWLGVNSVRCAAHTVQVFSTVCLFSGERCLGLNVCSVLYRCSPLNGVWVWGADIYWLGYDNTTAQVYRPPPQNRTPFRGGEPQKYLDDIFRFCLYRECCISIWHSHVFTYILKHTYRVS